MNALALADLLRPWIEHSLAQRDNILATSNQGTILLYRHDGQEFIIKAAMGRGLALRIRRKTLQREYQAYQRMQGVAGVPQCFGLIDDHYLVLEYIPGTPYREASWRDRDRWFSELLEVLQSIHARGISHGDLKAKGNLLVTEDERPCIVDFGTAFRHKRGFHPINNWLFRTGRRLDLNAWVKHKYHGMYRDASPTDLALLDYGWLEVLARRLSGRPMDRLPRPVRQKDSD